MPKTPAHGGLSRPIDRSLPLSKRKSLLAEAAGMPKLAVSAADLDVIRGFGDGTLSPLEGPMVEADYASVLERGAIDRIGESWAWTIPIALPATAAEAAHLEVGKRAAIVDPQGRVVAVLAVESVFEWDKARYLDRVYGDAAERSPGAAAVRADEREKLVGGKIQVLPVSPIRMAPVGALSPRRTRVLIADRKWDAVIAIPVGESFERADEARVVRAAEALTRKGYFTGVVVIPTFSADVEALRQRASEAVAASPDLDPHVWKDAGYEISDVLEVLAFEMKSYQAGAAEIVMQAIYAQNLGMSHLCPGGEPAHAEAFDRLGGALETRPI